jgi:hypothetical protein
MTTRSSMRTSTCGGTRRCRSCSRGWGGTSGITTRSDRTSPWSTGHRGRFIGPGRSRRGEEAFFFAPHALSSKCEERAGRKRMPGRRAEGEKEFSYRRSDGWQLFGLDNGVHFRRSGAGCWAWASPRRERAGCTGKPSNRPEKRCAPLASSRPATQSAAARLPRPVAASPGRRTSWKRSTPLAGDRSTRRKPDGE